MECLRLLVIPPSNDRPWQARMLTRMRYNNCRSALNFLDQNLGLQYGGDQSRHSFAICCRGMNSSRTRCDCYLTNEVEDPNGHPAIGSWALAQVGQKSKVVAGYRQRPIVRGTLD